MRVCPHDCPRGVVCKDLLEGKRSGHGVPAGLPLKVRFSSGVAGINPACRWGTLVLVIPRVRGIMRYLSHDLEFWIHLLGANKFYEATANYNGYAGSGSNLNGLRPGAENLVTDPFYFKNHEIAL